MTFISGTGTGVWWALELPRKDLGALCSGSEVALGRQIHFNTPEYSHFIVETNV